MRRSILYFLSRFSVKAKIGFIISFLIAGIVFWNLSYISINYNAYVSKVENLEDLQKVREVETLISAFQDERRAALDYLYVHKNARAFETSVQVTRSQLGKLDAILYECQYAKKQAAIQKSIAGFPAVRQAILARKLTGVEVVRYYTDGILKHLIDTISNLAQHNSSNSLSTYFDIISAVEYGALESDLMMAVMGDGSHVEDFYEIIVFQSGKAQSELDSFKRTAGKVAIKKLYASYRNGDFVEMNIQKENFRNYVFKLESEPFELSVWSDASSTYLTRLRAIINYEYSVVKHELKSETQVYLSRVYMDLLKLILPILLIIIVAYFIFIDINLSLQTMLDFLSGRRAPATKKDRLLLLKSPSELGQVYRKLFVFNTKINKQFKIIRGNYEVDPLTNLPNRVKLLDTLEGLLEARKKFTLVYIDIYNFSLINDSFGQSAGDIYLKETAKVLETLVQEISHKSKKRLQIYRMGSDEFVIVCEDQEYTEQIIEALSHTHLVRYNDIDMPLTFNFGMANSNDRSTKSSILTQAELAVKDAIAHQQRYSLYTGDDSYKIKYQTNLEWVKRIKSAFEQNRFEAHFQPIVLTEDESCNKFEVLIRLRDDENTIISPFEFLPVLQKMGLEKRLTKVIIDQSFELMHRCDKDISINMIRDDLDEEMLAYLESSMKKYAINAASVSIELVETEELLQEKYTKIIRKIKALGCKISIDDFGTGYSNFAYLTEIRPDFLKIDGSLIKDIDINAENRSIVKGIVDLARSLNIVLIAEFVSTPAIYAIIKELGIDYCQGYYFGKAESCEVILDKGKR